MLHDEWKSHDEYDSMDMNIVNEELGKINNILLSSNKIYNFANPSSKVNFDISHFSRT